MYDLLGGIVTKYLRKYRTVVLACFWVTGLFAGFFLYFQAGSDSTDLVFQAVLDRPSIGAVLFSLLMPLGFSAFLVFWNVGFLVYVFVFCKSCILSFFLMGVMDAFGSAGWLMRFLVLFSDSLLCVVLYLFWIRHLSSKDRISCSSVFSYMSWSVLIGSLDYCMISPCLGRIFD